MVKTITDSSQFHLEPNLEKESKITILGVHWGFVPGGVSKYSELLENIKDFAPLTIKSICIKGHNWKFDSAAASTMDIEIVRIVNRCDPSWIWKIRKIFKKEKPEIILTFGFNGCLVSLISKIGFKMPVMTSWHGEYFGTTINQKFLAPFYNFLTIVLLKYFVRQIVTVSDYSRNILIKKGISSRKIKRIYNGIPPSHFIKQNITESVFAESTQINKLVVGTICRLDVTKDLFTLLRAVQIVVKINDNIRFVVWGDGPLKNKLICFSKKLGISNYIQFAGHTNEIQKCLMSIDIFVLNSKIENFSISLLEAMRARLTIIATNVGGNPEAVSHNRQAILLKPGNPNELAFAILKMSKDPNLRSRLAEGAFKRFNQNFTSDRMICETALWIMECAKANN